MNPYNLFLDDQRKVSQAYLFGFKRLLVNHSEIPAGNWDVVRDYDQFIHKIKKKGIPRVVSFDNDLHPTHMDLFHYAAQTGVFKWESVQPRMGLHCLEFLLKTCEEKGVDLPIIYIHTANHFARQIMEEKLGIGGEKVGGIAKKDLTRRSKGGIILP